MNAVDNIAKISIAGAVVLGAGVAATSPYTGAIIPLFEGISVALTGISAISFAWGSVYAYREDNEKARPKFIAAALTGMIALGASEWLKGKNDHNWEDNVEQAAQRKIDKDYWALPQESPQKKLLTIVRNSPMGMTKENQLESYPRDYFAQLFLNSHPVTWGLGPISPFDKDENAWIAVKYKCIKEGRRVDSTGIKLFHTVSQDSSVANWDNLSPFNRQLFVGRDIPFLKYDNDYDCHQTGLTTEEEFEIAKNLIQNGVTYIKANATRGTYDETLILASYRQLVSKTDL